MKGVLQDPRFIAEGKVFGVDLISSVVRAPQCQEDFKQLVIRTLQNESVRLETIELLRYLIGRKEAEDIMAVYFKQVFVRDDMLHGVSRLLTKAAVKTLESPTTRDKFGSFALKVAGDEKVKSELYNNFLFRPAKRIFTFGLYSGSEEEKPSEEKR